MRKQSDFVKPITEDLHEVLDPEENQGEGEFKTKNPATNRWQRTKVHVENKKSKFNKTVEMALCVHGYEEENQKQPMSLVVFRLHFSCGGSSARYKSATVWFDFYENEGNKEGTQAQPAVVAYAPFNKNARWNIVKADLRRQIELGGELGAEYIASLKATASAQWEIKYEGKYFDEGAANPNYNDKKGITEGVKWDLKAKKLPDKESSAVEPDILVAILLKRNETSTGGAIPFSMLYDSRLEGGLQHDIMQGIHRILVPWKPEDEAIYFDPTLPDHVFGDDGVRCYEVVSKYKYKMGELAKEDMMVGLCGVPGLGAVS
jgi:hypothetical protein